MEPSSTPGLMLGHKLDARPMPKPHVRIVPRSQVIEQDGGRFLMGEGGELSLMPDDLVYVFEGDRVDESLLDFVVLLVGIYAEPSSVLTADNKPRGAAVTLLEVARVDFCEFKKRGRAALSGVKNVPGFNELDGPWLTQPEKT